MTDELLPDDNEKRTAELFRRFDEEPSWSMTNFTAIASIMTHNETHEQTKVILMSADFLGGEDGTETKTENIVLSVEFAESFGLALLRNVAVANGENTDWQTVTNDEG